jgi:hypothetical protein
VGALHNGSILDDREPGIRGPRFLWYLRPSARVVSTGMHSDDALAVAEIPDRVRRAVRVMVGRLVVRDEMLASAARPVRICWLLRPDTDPALVRVEGPSQPWRRAIGNHLDGFRLSMESGSFRAMSRSSVMRSKGR